MEESPNVKHMRDAVRLSEDQEIEQTMFEDKLKTTDWEATNEEIEEQIARESYLQWCRESHQKKQQQQKQFHQQLLMSTNSDPLKTYSIQSSSTITSTTVTTSVGESFRNHSQNRDSDDSISCDSIDNYLSGNEKLSSMDDGNNSSVGDGTDKWAGKSNQSRKRRSNRRKMSNAAGKFRQCHRFNGNQLNRSICVEGSTDEGLKKRKISNQDLPGPSYYKDSSPDSHDRPMSEFYHSLLESSYADATNGN